MHVCNQVALSEPEYSDVDDDSESSASRPVEKGNLGTTNAYLKVKSVQSLGEEDLLVDRFFGWPGIVDNEGA